MLLPTLDELDALSDEQYLEQLQKFENEFLEFVAALELGMIGAAKQGALLLIRGGTVVVNVPLGVISDEMTERIEAHIDLIKIENDDYKIIHTIMSTREGRTVNLRISLRDA